MALTNFMRLSLRRAAHAALSSAAWQKSEKMLVGLRWLKSSEQHWQDKHLRGSLGYARDRLFDSAPPSAVSRDKSVRRSAQDDDFVGVLTKNIPNQVSAYALKAAPFVQVRSLAAGGLVSYD